MAPQKDDSKDAAAAPEKEAWEGFTSGRWQIEIDVQNFIQKNYTPYEGDSSFLAGATDRTKSIWDQVLELVKEEHKKGVLDAEPVAQLAEIVGQFHPAETPFGGISFAVITKIGGNDLKGIRELTDNGMP